MAEKKITLDIKQVAALVITLLGAGGTVGMFAPSAASTDYESQVADQVAQVERKWKDKEMLDSISRVASSVCALRGQVSMVQNDVRILMDTVNSLSRRGELSAPRRTVRSDAYSMVIPARN